ncbi:MAG: hypothetical protein P4L87_11020 [Formivibrio sp.]|nr:hypothetical protein [Formivibrio sp.]
MSDQLLALGVIGVRLYDCILTSSATYPEELADNIVNEINNYLDHATPREKVLLFHLACDIHEALSLGFHRIDGLEKRQSVLRMVCVLISRARIMAK